MFTKKTPVGCFIVERNFFALSLLTLLMQHVQTNKQNKRTLFHTNYST